MKKFYFFLLFSFFSMKGFSQSSSFSTFREVYDFEVGDTFETSSYSHHTIVQPHLDQNGIQMDIVLSRQDSSDVVIYQFKQNYEGYWSDGTHSGSNNGTGNYYRTFSLLDSTVYWNHTHLNFGCDTNSNCSFDSVYLDSSLTSGKINEHRISDWASLNRIIYADGLGQVLDVVASEDFDVEQGGRSLIYYHKANGKKWGNPNYFIVDGINDLEGNELTIQVFPNPTITTFQLQLSSSIHQPTHFKLYEALGREVKEELISSTITTLSRENLSNGIYFWQVETEGKILERGKIIFE